MAGQLPHGFYGGAQYHAPPPGLAAPHAGLMAVYGVGHGAGHGGGHGGGNNGNGRAITINSPLTYSKIIYLIKSRLYGRKIVIRVGAGERITPEDAAIKKLAKIQKEAKTFKHVQKWAPPDARTTVMVSFEEKFDQILRVYATDRRMAFVPMTVLTYIHHLAPDGGTLDDLYFSLSSVSYASLRSWEQKIAAYLQLLNEHIRKDVNDRGTGRVVGDPYDTLTTVGDIEEDTNGVFAREKKYTEVIMNVICETRQTRLNYAYAFLWVCKNLDYVPRDISNIIVEYIKNGG